MTSKRERVLAIGVVGLLLMIPGLLLAQGQGSFPGKESGARQAAEQGLAQQVSVNTTQAGLNLQVLAIIADDSQTFISYAIRGREAEGSTAISASPPQLIDSRGATHLVLRGSLDETDRRTGTWVFPAIPAVAGTLSLVVNDFQLDTPRQGQPTAVTKVPGVWTAQIPWNGQTVQAGPATVVPPAPTTLGHGSVRLTTIKQAATGTIIQGTLDNFSSQVVQAMGCPMTGLEQLGGTQVPWTACRLGFGEGNRSFEISYPQVSGNVKLNFQVTFPSRSGRPDQPALTEAQRQDEGARAVVDVVLPSSPTGMPGARSTPSFVPSVSTTPQPVGPAPSPQR